MMKKQLTAILLAAVVGLCACGADDSVKTQMTQESESGLKEITVILDYVPNTNHTGMYVALEKGYYESEGLAVSIIEPTDAAANTVVAQGKADFGVTYQEDLTIALSSEDPLPIKAVAALIQHNTSGFVSLADSGITSPADFEGKIYAGWGGPGELAVVEAVMKKAGADYTKLERVISDGTGFEALGKNCDIMWFFEAWDSVQAEMNGVEINYMPCRKLDERLDYYTPILVARDEMIASDPETIRAFLRATEKGYRDTIAKPDEGAEILAKYAQNYDLEMLKRSQEILAEKFMEDTDIWGSMKDEVWDHYTAFLNEYGVIDKKLKAADCYTNEFLGG